MEPTQPAHRPLDVATDLPESTNDALLAPDPVPSALVGPQSTEPTASGGVGTEPLGAETISKRAAYWALRLASVVAYRGHDRGLPLYLWATVVALGWLIAVAIAPLEPFWLMVPPAVGLAALYPAFQAVYLAVGRAAHRRWLRWVEPVVAIVAFAWLAQGVFGYLFRYGISINSFDHHIMIARAELLTKGLAAGHLPHWSHLFQGGDSLVDLYPVFLNYVTALLHSLAPDGTPFITTYTALCVLAWWFRGVTAYALCRRFTGPLPAAAVALASLFEVGADVSDGVWSAALAWGMIHNTVALSFGLLATALQVDACRRATTRRLLLCTALVAVTSVTHPLGLLYVVVSSSALAAAVLIRRARKRRPAWALIATVAGLALASVWVLPYTYALRHYGFNGALAGVTYDTLGNGLYNGSVPLSSFGAYLGFGFVAVLAAIASRRTLLVATAVTSVIFILLGLSSFMVQSRLFDYFPSFLDAQQRRSFTVLKVASLPALASLLALSFRGLRQPSSARIVPVIGRAVLIGLVLFGPARVFAVGAFKLVNDLRAQTTRPGADGQVVDTSTTAEHREAFAWLKKARAADPSSTPWRVVLLDRFEPASHVHWVWVQGVETGVPVVDFGWMSANFLGVRPREFSVQGMHDWNIRYAIGVSPTPPFPDMIERFRSGNYRVWEITPYDDHFVTAPPGITVRDVYLEGDEIRFTVEGAPAEGVDVQIRTAYFPRWRAWQNGTSVSVRPREPHDQAKPRQEQVVVRVVNGPVVVRCDDYMPLFWAGLGVSCFGFSMTALLAVASLRRRGETCVRRGFAAVSARALVVRAAISASRGRGRRVLLAVSIVATVAAVAIIAFRGGKGLRLSPVEGVGVAVAFQPAGHEAAEPCAVSWMIGGYKCREREGGGVAMSVEPGLGGTRFEDDAGEYDKLWPGTLVAFKEKGVATLTFSRIATQSGEAHLTGNVGGALRVSFTASGATSPPQEFQGNFRGANFMLDHPVGVSDVVMRVEALSDDAWIVFRASFQ